jgi:hypothetical protein
VRPRPEATDHRRQNREVQPQRSPKFLIARDRHFGGGRLGAALADSTIPVAGV